jgi:hypothetical protein
MRTLTPKPPSRKQMRRIEIQRETIITPILAEKFKRERREKDDCRILDSGRVSGAK